MFLLPPALKPGTITQWYSSVGSIPPGWALCDGTNGTPDLRDKFITGAGVGFAVGAEGGKVTHTHWGITDGHSHSLTGIGDLDSTYLQRGSPASKDDSLIVDSANHLPYYHSIVFIMALE